MEQFLDDAIERNDGNEAKTALMNTSNATPLNDSSIHERSTTGEVSRLMPQEMDSTSNNNTDEPSADGGGFMGANASDSVENSLPKRTYAVDLPTDGKPRPMVIPGRAEEPEPNTFELEFAYTLVLGLAASALVISILLPRCNR